MNIKNTLFFTTIFSIISLTTFSQVADRLYKPNNTAVDTVSPYLVTATVNPTTTQQPSMYSVNKNLLKWNTSQIRGLRDTIINIGSSQGYLNSEVDPIFFSSASYNITNSLISSWNLAYSWGNHSGLYPLLTGSYSNPSWVNSLSWSKIIGAPSFLTTETDPIYSSSSWFGTTNNASDWNTAYSNRISSLTTIGNSGSASFSSNVLNIPNYTLSGLGGQPQLSGTGFVKINGTTISYDNSTYLTTTLASSTYQPIGSYEVLSNKAVNLSTLNNTLYPTTQAVANYVSGLGYLNASSGVTSSRVLTINGLSQDLSSDRSWIVGDLLSSGSYSNPSWLTSLQWSKITGSPTTLIGYGITDGVTSSALTTALSGKENSIPAGTTGQYWRGDKTWQTLSTASVVENTNLYYTDVRARSAISLTTVGTSGVATYNNSTGVLNIPDYSSSITDNTVTRAINSSTYTISSTKPATVKYNIKIVCSASIGSNSSGKVLFQYSINGGSTWVDAGEVENSNQVTLAIALNSTTTQSGFIVWSVPANALCRLVPTSSGTTTITWIRGQETY